MRLRKTRTVHTAFRWASINKTSMKQLIIIILISICNPIYSQNSVFDDLIKDYEKDKVELDKSIAKKYFDVDFNPGVPKAYTDKIVLKNKDFIGLSCLLPCMAGGLCETSRLVIFDYSGNKLDKLEKFEYTFADCAFRNTRFCAYSSDTLLILTNKEIKKDCDQDTVLDKSISLNYIRINTGGRLEHSKNITIDTRREYYNTSIEILNAKDLSDKSDDELAIMRNEIFAAHGYDFKTTKWKNYFNGKYWYEPVSRDVNDKLSIIEKKNIELIMKNENN